MKKLTILLLLTPTILFGQEMSPLPQDLVYTQASMGYIDMPISTAFGMVATNNRQSEIYLISEGEITTLVSAPGCGRYMHPNTEKTKIAFKYINENDEQAPAILDLATREVSLLDEYAYQCGQPSFAEDGSTVYTTGNQLVVNTPSESRRFDLGYYVNIANIAPDGSYVTFSNSDGQPMLLNLTNEETVSINDVSDCYINTISPEGGHVVFEQAKGELFVYDAQTGAFRRIGKGCAAQWLDEEHLVYCRPEYIEGNVFTYLGTSIITNNFLGTEARAIIPTSTECPQQVAVIDAEHIAVPFSNSDRRLSVIDINNPEEETILYAIEDGYVFGDDLNRREHSISPRLAPADTKLQGTIGIHDIPYINQVYDTPDSYAGCHSYGSVACGPTTSCMLLAYYGFFEKHAVTSRRSNCAWGQTNYYSWYVGQEYTAPLTSYTFSTIAEGNGCNAKGAYGYMWYGSYSPNSRMVDFYKKNGITNTKHNDNGLSIIRSECAADRPYSWCITSGKSNGHLILPFRADAKCVKVNGVWTLQEGKTGSVVVQDPYGDANNSTWCGDGRYSTYDYNGYNNGYYTMVNAWGVTVAYDNGIHVEKVTLDYDSVTLHVGESIVLHATITPTNATDNSVTWASSAGRIAACAGSTIPLTQKISAKKEGEATIYVKTTDGGKTASCVITVLSPAGLGEMENKTTTSKRIRNGQLIIIRDGKTYDVMGQELNRNY